MRDADFGCGPHTACYDPSIVDGASWWPDWLLVIIIAALVLILLWALLKTESKKEQSVGDWLDDKIEMAKKEAENWDNKEAEKALERFGSEVKKELGKRNLLDA